MYRTLLTPIVMLLSICALVATKAAREKGVVNILGESELFLTGRTNINAFACNCEQDFAPLTYQLSQTADGYKFHSTELRVRVQSLDCGRKAINKDLYEALCVEEHPEISIRPLNVDLSPQVTSGLGEECWFNLEVKTAVELAGTTREVILPVEACALDEGQWHLRSRKTLSMLDFDIDPPVAMAGLIKVREHIDIHFDLVVAYHTPD